MGPLGLELCEGGSAETLFKRSIHHCWGTAGLGTGKWTWELRLGAEADCGLLLWLRMATACVLQPQKFRPNRPFPLPLPFPSLAVLAGLVAAGGLAGCCLGLGLGMNLR